MLRKAPSAPITSLQPKLYEPPATVEKVLLWAKAHNGIVTADWVKNQKSGRVGRIIFSSHGKRCTPKYTSALLKEIINEFWRDIDHARCWEHACVIKALMPDGKMMAIWMLESSLQTYIPDTISASDLRQYHFPNHSDVRDIAYLCTFMGVPGMQVEHVVNERGEKITVCESKCSRPALLSDPAPLSDQIKEIQYKSLAS